MQCGSLAPPSLAPSPSSHPLLASLLILRPPPAYVLLCFFPTPAAVESGVRGGGRVCLLRLWAFYCFFYLGLSRSGRASWLFNWPPCNNRRCYNTTHPYSEKSSTPVTSGSSSSSSCGSSSAVLHPCCTSLAPLVGKLPPPADASRTVWPSRRWVPSSLNSCSVAVIARHFAGAFPPPQDETDRPAQSFISGCALAACLSCSSAMRLHGLLWPGS